jgi:two-component system, OmpR family, sensor histidine kinase CiaH
MQHESKQFGAKDINSFRKRFSESLAQLTFLYILTLVVILCISGYITYSEFSSRIGKRFNRFPPTQPAQFKGRISPNALLLNNQPTAEDVRDDLIGALIFVNSFLLILASISSYWLARRTLQPIKHAYERQRRFLSDASHELRTPLSILQLELENEIRNTQNIPVPELRGLAESKLEEVKRMGKLVHDLLVLSRLDEDTIHSVKQKETFDLVAFLEALVRRLQPLTKVNQLHLTFATEKDTPDPLLMTVDENLCTHALTNLILNAILYNVPSGSVRVTVATIQKNAVIKVIDTGIGIAQPDLDLIFERFYRADKSRSRKTGGSGLGLSIAESAIHRIGGTIQIESTPSVGTTVIVHIPLFTVTS